MGRLDVLGAAREVNECIHAKRFREKLDYRSHTLTLDLTDLTRCSLLLHYKILHPLEAAQWYRSEDIFQRNLFTYGIRQLLRLSTGGQDRRVIVERKYVLSLDPGQNAAINIVDPASGSVVRRVSLKRIVVEALADAYFPKRRELLLVRYAGRVDIKESSQLPLRHHIEQAAILQWLAMKRGDRVDKVRIIYFGLNTPPSTGLIFREFTVRTLLTDSIGFPSEFEKRLERRVQGLLDPQAYPLYDWECSICYVKDWCRARKSKPEARPEALINDGEYEVNEDRSLRVTLEVIRMLMEREFEHAKTLVYRRQEERIEAVKVPATQLLYCPYRFRFSMHLPYAGITRNLSAAIIRGQIMHYGIEYLLLKLRDCPETASKLGVSMLWSEVPLEYSSVRRGKPVILVGRADLVVVYSDGSIEIIELKTSTQKPDKPRQEHKAQLEAYLTLMILKSQAAGENIGINVNARPESVTGRLVYIYLENEEKSNRVRLASTEFKAEKPMDYAELDRHLENLIYGHEPVPSQCPYCEFRSICPYNSSSNSFNSRSRRGG